MLSRLKKMLLLTAVSLALAACAGVNSSGNSTKAPNETPLDEQLYQPSDRPSLTAIECQQRGGKIVGDIGDGAIHRPDYLCKSGAAPIGTVVFNDGQAAPIEGAVCCQ